MKKNTNQIAPKPSAKIPKAVTAQSKEIKVATMVPVPLHQLLTEAVASIYHITPEQLFENNRTMLATRRRGLLFYLMKNDLGYTDTEISTLTQTKRQRVSASIGHVEWDLEKSYLQVSCDCKNIRAIYSNLLKEQEKCLTQVSQ